MQCERSHSNGSSAASRATESLALRLDYRLRHPP
jgi:hypothetical protein